MEWPEHFPDSCPPAKAKSATGEVYRLLNGGQPKARDFRSYKEIYPDQDFSPETCDACGLSVFVYFADIERLRRRVPATRKKYVAKGTLNPDYGKMESTPVENTPSHHTWWVPIGVQPWSIFAVVAGPEDHL